MDWGPTIGQLSKSSCALFGIATSKLPQQGSLARPIHDLASLGFTKYNDVDTVK
jgi:hypothetical protein